MEEVSTQLGEMPLYGAPVGTAPPSRASFTTQPYTTAWRSGRATSSEALPDFVCAARQKVGSYARLVGVCAFSVPQIFAPFRYSLFLLINQWNINDFPENYKKWNIFLVNINCLTRGSALKRLLIFVKNGGKSSEVELQKNWTNRVRIEKIQIRNQIEWEFKELCTSFKSNSNRIQIITGS